MKPRKLMVLLLVAFVLALAAGVSGGMLLARLPAVQGDLTGDPVPGASPLAAELGLSSEQAEQMRRIWEGVRETAQECLADGRRLQKDRDEALVALLDERQKAEFERISKDYAGRFEELNHKRDKEFQQAVRRTREVLSEQQWRKYEKILRNRVGPGPLRWLDADEGEPQGGI